MTSVRFPTLLSPRILLPAAFLSLTFGLAILISGGFVTTVFGMRASARSPLPAFALGLVLIVVWVVTARWSGRLAPDLVAADRWISRRASFVVLAVALLAGATAVAFNSFSATGSDGSGYLSQAAMLAQGAMTREEPLTPLAKWPDAATTLTPLGWRAALEVGYQAPTYAVGLPLLLAPFHALGGTMAASLVVPLCLVLAIWATGGLALRLAGPYAAILAAVWFATSPVALIESMQVMSDVPATAAWMLCWYLAVREKPLPAGLAAAAAVAIRPNLAPLAAMPALYLRHTGVLGFAAPVTLAGVLVGYFHWRWFGSPLRSGYGTAGQLYAFANVGPNAPLYVSWLLDTHGPWLLATPVALVWPRIRAMRWLLAFAALVVAAYLIFSVFEVWRYLRFVLPALAIGMIAVSAMVAAMLARLPKGPHPIGLAILVLALAAANIASARDHGVFRFADQQARARVVGERLADQLPVNAVIVSGEQSGAMRYYTDRSIVRWDLAAPDVLDAALDQLIAHGYVVWVVLDDWEEEPFRRKFPAAASAVLNRPPAVESAPGVGIRTRAWPVIR
ncbi:MAG: hypothetical protein H0T71_14845 [Acidobacteria bacterium]|nr:hypothetical protein [Acidobacteriota bacterium]